MKVQYHAKSNDTILSFFKCQVILKGLLTKPTKNTVKHCAVPENIHASRMKLKWKFQRDAGEGAGDTDILWNNVFKIMHFT